MAVGVTLTTGVGVTLTTDEDVGVGVALTTDEDVGVGVTLTTGEGVGEDVGEDVGEGVGVGEDVGEDVAPTAWCGSIQSAVDEATAMITIKDSTNTREMKILDPPACNDDY